MRRSLGVARRILSERRQGARLGRFSPQVSGRPLVLGLVLPKFTVDDLIKAYRTGLIPNADAYDDRYLTLADPARRAIMPIDTFKVSTNLARTVRNTSYEVRFDHDFPRLLELCSEPAPDRQTTWMGEPMRRFYQELFARGLAHSSEVWDGETLLGGCITVVIGGAQFGESMVSRARDVSKIALVHTMARLARGGFCLVDCQYMSDHLRQFGAIEISREDYLSRLSVAIELLRDFASVPAMSGTEALDSLKVAALNGRPSRAA